MTGFIFNVIGAAEAERLGKNGIKWKGKIRKILVLNKWDSGKQNATPPKKGLTQKRKEKVKKGRHHLNKASFTFVICYNYMGKEYSMKSYTSGRRAVSKKSERRTE